MEVALVKELFEELRLVSKAINRIEVGLAEMESRSALRHLDVSSRLNAHENTDIARFAAIEQAIEHAEAAVENSRGLPWKTHGGLAGVMTAIGVATSYMKDMING